MTKRLRKRYMKQVAILYNQLLEYGVNMEASYTDIIRQLRIKGLNLDK